MQHDVYRRLDEKPYDSHYFYHEATILQPIAKVWPCALAIGAWMSDHVLETVAGEPGHVGHFERVLPRGLGADVQAPHYHLYGIAAVVPHKLIALEVFPEKGGSYGDATKKTSFDSILLTDLGRSTRVGFLMIDVAFEKYGDAEAEEVKLREKDERVRKRLDGYFANLARQAAV